MSDTTSSQTHYHWTRCSWMTRRERRREKRRRSRVGELEADEADRGDEEDRVEADRGVEDVDVDSKARGVKCVYGRKGRDKSGKDRANDTAGPATRVRFARSKDDKGKRGGRDQATKSNTMFFNFTRFPVMHPTRVPLNEGAEE